MHVAVGQLATLLIGETFFLNASVYRCFSYIPREEWSRLCVESKIRAASVLRAEKRRSSGER